MFHRNLTLRLDDNTHEILNALTGDLNVSKAEIIRKSLRTFKQLREFERKYGAIRLLASNDKELLILLT